VRASALALLVALSLGALGCGRSFAEEASAKPAAKEQSAKEQPAKEKPAKESASKETATKHSGEHHSVPIDTRLPGPPARRTGPGVSHAPALVVPRPSVLPPSQLPPIGVRPITPGIAAQSPHGNDAARSAFGAVTHHPPGIAAKPASPAIVIAPAPNHGVINGTTMTRHAAGPATVGGPAKNPGVINGTTIRRKP
jgi:hypothetical protein